MVWAGRTRPVQVGRNNNGHAQNHPSQAKTLLSPDSAKTNATSALATPRPAGRQAEPSILTAIAHDQRTPTSSVPAGCGWGHNRRLDWSHIIRMDS
jgi:hypothetical protein